jgi:hypothetical protein
MGEARAQRDLAGKLPPEAGNLAYLGKLRNIRKSAEEPSIYFKRTSADELTEELVTKDFTEMQTKELRENLLIEDSSLLVKDCFKEFIERRRSRVLESVRAFLGR